MTRPASAPAGTGTLESLLEGERVRVDGALEEIAERYLARVPESLRSPLAYALSTSGKRIRPILFLAAYRAVRAHSTEDLPPAVYRLASAVEIIHTYSLVHDDLPCMDDDDLRRGRPTVHRVHGTRTAMVAGAALLPMAVEVVTAETHSLGLGNRQAAALVRELCRAAGAEGMVGGQLLDLEGESRDVDGAALEAIHRAKTGALLTAALRLGGIAAGAGQEALHALAAYGEALGLAFQIADDILDVVGDTESLGKAAGRDQALSKASYPSLYGLDRARALAREKADQAKTALAGVPSAALVGLADYVVERRR